MNRTKLVLVARRCWPLVGGTESTLARLAEGLASRGAAVTVVTPRWDNTWPEETVCRGTRIVRLPPPVGGWLATQAWLRRLGGWFDRRRGQIDVAWVAQLKHDAWAVQRASRRNGFPVVLHPWQPGPSGDCYWQIEHGGGARIKRECLRAAGLVAFTRQLQRELIAAGYPRERIHYVPLGVPVVESSEPGGCEIARRDLADACSVLQLPPRAPVILYLGSLEPGRGVAELIDAFQIVSRRFPAARLWLAGYGSLLPSLVDQIARQGLSGRAVLAGTFDDAEQLLAAANVLVCPTQVDRLPVAMLEAMASGLPVLASDVASVRSVLTDGADGYLVPPGSIHTWAARIEQLLADPAHAIGLGAAGRRRVLAEARQEAMIDAAWQLVERLLVRTPAGD